ncbi:hypothetical protein D3C80_1522630 [compost metagenome]
MLLAIQAEHRAMFEIQQGQGQNAVGRLALLSRDERHRRLMRQADAPGTVVGRQPELDFGARRCVTPMPGQDEALG